MNPSVKGIVDQATINIQVEGSAAIVINGFAARLQAAADAAVANGATAEQLAPVTAEIQLLKDSSDALASAIAANTPAAP